MSDWQPIETAPRDRPFLAKQDGEIYLARFSDDGRISFRTHQFRQETTHQVIKAQLDGKQVEASVLIKEGPELFEHHWTFWTRGFHFAPTEWAEPPK